MAQAARVIDLDSFRRKKEQDKAPALSLVPNPPMVFVPVWVCWVPYWPMG